MKDLAFTWSTTGETSKKFEFAWFHFFKWDGLVSLKFHSIFIHQHTIPPIFCSTMIVKVRWPRMTTIRLNWCHNPVVQLISLCIFIESCSLYGTSILFKGYRSMAMSQVALECAKYLQLSDSGWHNSKILTYNAASVFRNTLKYLPGSQASSEYFLRRCYRSLSFLLTPCASNLDPSIASSVIGNVFLCLCIF